MEYNFGNMEFINRELSWIDFNYRVLEEAENPKNKSLEKLKFLAISASNLDEFFMVRIAGLKDQIAAGYSKKDNTGMNPKDQLRTINGRIRDMIGCQYSCLKKIISKDLNDGGIFFRHIEDLNDKQKEYVNSYFHDAVFPILTPLAIDKSRPFPLLANLSLNLIVEVMVGEEKKIAVVQVPKNISRFLKIPFSEDKNSIKYVFTEEIIKNNIGDLFPGYKVENVYTFRITRNADLGIDEDEIEDLLKEIEKNLRKRKWGQTVRLEVQYDISDEMLEFLKEKLDVHNKDIYKIKSSIDLNMWMDFYFKNERFELKDEPHIPVKATDFSEGNDIFEVIKEKDCLLHHPYESFDSVIEFISKAASDPKVLAIKQTLYRVSGDSPIIAQLIRAAENGKQVTVLVELKARFDEANNIIWAKKLEKAGCHVIYGIKGLKTHCKMILIVRQEEDGIRRYVHMSTGNYNDKTAKLYTDIGFFTSKESYCSDANTLFNYLTGFSKFPKWKKLAVAPYDMRKFFLKNIDNEIENAKNGKKALIIAKMNSLVDEEIIRKFYEANMAGVHITLMVRGICCLRPGVENQSENIMVKSVVGTFLEHSRIYYFYDDGREKIFLSSADLMPRNLDRRVEVAFPIEDEELHKRTKNIIDITLRDTKNARILEKNGFYKYVDKRGKEVLSSQEYFKIMAKERSGDISEENRNN